MNLIRSIAVVSGSQKFDGIYRTTTNFITALGELGFDVTPYQLVDPGHNFSYGKLHDQVELKGLYLPLKSVEMGFNRLYVYPSHISKLTEDEVLLCDTTLAATMKQRLSRATVRVQDMRPLSPYKDNRFTSLMFKHVLPKLNGAKGLIVESDFVEQELVDRGIHKELIHRIPPVSTFSEDRERALKHIKGSVNSIGEKGPLRCCCVSTDRPYKNIRFYLEIVKHFLNSEFRDSVTFSLLSKLRPSTVNIIKDLHLTNLTVFGSTEDLEGYYSGHDLLFFPSLYEGFGLPILEAMSLGIPAIVSDLPPMKGIVQDGGAVCAPNKKEDWATAILKFTDPQYYGRVALGSLERHSTFSFKRFKQEVSMVFRN